MVSARGQVEDREWRDLVERHGGEVVRSDGAWLARFPTGYQRELYTKDFLALAHARLRDAGRLGYDGSPESMKNQKRESA